MAHIIRAFSKGIDGVFIGGCRLNDCNYITQGNYHALNKVLLFKKIMKHIGLNPDRLRIEFLSSSEGNLFAEVVSDFSKQIKELGPLGKGEGTDEDGLKLSLQAAAKLIPYIRLVESEKLRVRFDTIEEYQDFYAGEELNRLFGELIAEKLAVSQIMLLLKERPLAAGEMAQVLGLTPSEIAKIISYSAKQGLVRYDESQKRYALP
jgi:hypothetical protein